jgi:hypothetical protein
MIAAMIQKPLLFLAMFAAASGVASAGQVTVSASGQFGSSDVADSPLVAPNGLFSLSFVTTNNPAPLAGSVSSLGFDIPVDDFLYMLNGTPESVTPSEITFNTLANGGLFNVTIGSGLTAEEFDFEGAQAFSGTTAAPVFATGPYAVSNWTYSDPVNFDVETPASSAVSINPSPEPSTLLLISGGLLTSIAWKSRKR